MEILSLRGRPALSPFRGASCTKPCPGSGHRTASLRCRPVTGTSSRPRVRFRRPSVRRSSASSPTGTATPLTRAPASRCWSCPSGTISPWSSKATDIAHNCGLAAVNRIERGVVWHVATADGDTLSVADREALLPQIHDRMVEALFDDLAEASRLLAHVEPRPLEIVPLLARGRAAIEAANMALVSRSPRTRSITSNRRFVRWDAIRPTSS